MTAALRVAALLLVAWVALGLLARWVSERMIFQPGPSSYAPAEGSVRIPVGEGDTLAALWLPAPGAERAVLFHHGNAEDLGDLRPFLERMRSEGLSVLAFDYRGYGASTGLPSEANALADAEAAYRWLTEALDVPPERVVLHGRSLGGAVALDLATRVPAAGLVLESTFTSPSEVVLPGPPLPFGRFPSLRRARRARRVRMPVLVIHGTEDGVIPARHGRRLLAAVRGPASALWVEGAGHDDLTAVAGEGYWRALRRFAGGVPPAGDGP